MGDPSDDADVHIERASPEDSFGALASDIRLETLQTMMEAPDEAWTFSDILDRVSIDDPGQLNYHLNRLVGHFIRRIDEGYRLTQAGREIVGAIYAGTYTAHAAVDPIPLDDSCITCGGQLFISYAAESANIECGDCARRSDDYPFPPQALDSYTRTELPRAIGRWINYYSVGLLAGFCPVCRGRIDGELVLDDGDERLAGFPAHARYTCDRCGMTHSLPGPAPVHNHPAFEYFVFRRGFDIHDPVWEIYGAVGRPETEIISDDPPVLEVTFTLEGERLRGIVDHTATVVDIEIESHGT